MNTKNQANPSTNQAGAAAMLAIVTLAVIFFLVTTGLIVAQLSKASIKRQLIYHGQAVNAARAGLVETLSWYRRQATQPVAAFSPQRDLTATPPLNDTDDPSVGLVRDFEISKLGSVWGRYEVRPSRVADVSAARGMTGSGAIWQIDSVGIVYVRSDPGMPHDQYPNRIVSRAYARNEFQRLTLVPPANAAINAARGTDVNLAVSTRVLGGNTGIAVAYKSGTGSPITNGKIDGISPTGQVNPYLDSIQDVFGVGQQELIGMADIVAASVTDLPARLPDMSLVVLTNDATFTSARPLIGNGILVALGDLTIAAGSVSNYNGVVYVEGDYTQQSPSQISGTVIGKGQISLQSAGDFSEVYYDPEIITQLQRQIGQYRLARSTILLKE
jgi:hypothetical protein